jgi:hypothetical protein
MGLGKPLGFTEKQVIGALVTHKTIPGHQAHEVSRSKHGMSTCAQRSSTGQPRDYDDKSWKHPGEFGRVSAWLKRSKRDLEIQPNVDGHPPSAIFQQRADMYITIPAIPTPAGMTAPDASTGEAYLRRTDGAPKLKRSINFTSPSLGGGGVPAPAATWPDLPIFCSGRWLIAPRHD